MAIARQTGGGDSNPLRWPITVGTALLAVANTALWWSGHYDVQGLVLSSEAFWAEPWRLLTSTLLHGGVLHLLFNLYWLWIFGRWIESEYGQARTLAFFAVVAVGSGAAEFALFRGGVGLSGVGYGMFAFLWAAGRREPRYTAVVDQNVVTLFVGWFFFCIVATAADVLQIANVAHGMGALLGGAVGFAATTKGRERVAWSGLFTALIAVSLAGASVARPYVNIGGGGIAVEREAESALDEGEPERAAKLYRQVIESYGETARLRYNLGVAFQQSGRFRDAAEAFGRAAELDPHDEQYASAAVSVYVWLAKAAFNDGNYEKAVTYVHRARDAGKLDPKSWRLLGEAHRRLGHTERAQKAFQHTKQRRSGSANAPDAGASGD